MFERIAHITVKEFIQLWRDKWGRFRLIVPPLLQMLVFGYAATFEIYNVQMAVLDFDHTQESRELVSRFAFSPYFHLQRIAGRDSTVADTIESGEVPLALVIHAGFAKALTKGGSAPVEVVVDGTNSNTALVALGYVGAITSQFSADYAAKTSARETSSARAVTVSLEPRPWFNPDLNSRWFFVPGVIATITIVMVVNLCAFAVVREREMGTLEQIMVTPIRSSEFILGKTVPFFLVGLGIVALIAGTGIVWFDVPFTGNPFVLLLGTALFLLCALALGLLISTVCRTQQQAFAANFLVLNPLYILSGFAFPISSMPMALQWITALDPLRFYLVVIRATFLKGVGLADLWPYMASMAVLGAALLALSVLRFRKSLD
ncbi:MAG TPA: ABC transporter permease [Stellaceae bacterium]|nr:ABC transporter permease [Stellaceae bacterium]